MSPARGSRQFFEELPDAVSWSRSAHSTRPASDSAPPSEAGPRSCAAVVFSPSGVFYDDTLFARWMVQLLNRLGVQTEYSAFRCLLQRDALRRAYLGQAEYWDALRSLLADIGLTRGQVAEVEAAGYPRWQQQNAQLRLLPGVASTVSQLTADGLRLAALVNSVCCATDLRESWQSLGLADCLEVVLTSRDIGSALPDRGAVERMLAALELPAEQVAFISSCPAELTVAASLGLLAVSVLGDSLPGAVRSVRRIGELVPLLTSPPRPLAA